MSKMATAKHVPIWNVWAGIIGTHSYHHKTNGFATEPEQKFTWYWYETSQSKNQKWLNMLVLETEVFTSPFSTS